MGKKATSGWLFSSAPASFVIYTYLPHSPFVADVGKFSF
jgi:hypothetical protein